MIVKVLKVLVWLFAIYSIYRGYDVFFNDAYILGDELSDDSTVVTRRKHIAYGIMFAAIGFYVIYHLIVSHFDDE